LSVFAFGKRLSSKKALFFWDRDKEGVSSGRDRWDRMHVIFRGVLKVDQLEKAEKPEEV